MRSAVASLFFWLLLVVLVLVVALTGSAAHLVATAKPAGSDRHLELPPALLAIRECESRGNYAAVNEEDWHKRWEHHRGVSHFRQGSYGAFQFGWGRWHYAAAQAGHPEHAHTRPDRVPPHIQDQVALWQFRHKPSVWSCY